MPRCLITLNDTDYTTHMRGILRRFMDRKYGTRYLIDLDRKQGSVYFELPEENFERNYAELSAQLNNRHAKAHFRRTKIKLSIVPD